MCIRDRLQWVWQERERSIHRLRKAKGDDELRSAQGEFITTEKIYSFLVSHLEEDDNGR